MDVDLFDATHYAKMVGFTVAVCLIEAEGDPDEALRLIAERVDVGAHHSPEFADMNKTLVEQAIREARERCEV